MQRTGRCLCGQVSYRIDGEPLAVRICWCRDCQHVAGNGTANATFLAASLHVEGTPAEHVKIADSGNALTRRFCAACGSHLWSVSSARAHLVTLRIGTLDDPSSVVPSANIWTVSAPAWARPDPALERFDRQPPAPQVAPPAS